ncbi:hypothetical protein H5410_026477 [Solanum commersonii]|uniref:Uncharacterized protein n=1 Tax=Solanum commersonii TaxID=4109 RepID=A0A9J5YWN4_SOLCO|nr:hypothetical protein H5410_026477 [Solanum commersonii]
MNSGDGSVSRWLCQNCKRPITKKGYTTCECGCETWVDDETHEKWPFVVDIPLGSPPLTIEGENNKGPIPLSLRRKFIPGTCEEISDSSKEESDPDCTLACC